MAGHEFDDWPAFERHLSWWMDEIADTRIHGTTGEPPLVRFEREEAQALTSFEPGRAFGVVLEHERVVNSEACVNFETNSYSVPWRLISARVVIRVDTNSLRVFADGECVAEHALLQGRHLRQIQQDHLEGMGRTPHLASVVRADEDAVASSSLARPLSEYADFIAKEAS